MNFIPTVYIDSRENINIDIAEGYICGHSFDEETKTYYYYTSKETNREIKLTDEYIFEQTGIQYSLIKNELNKTKDKQTYIENIENPLIKYKAQQELNFNNNNNSKIKNFSNQDIVGAKVLLTLNPQYHKTPLITQTNQYLGQDKKTNKPIEQVASFLNFTSQYQNLIEDKQQLYSSLIIQTENIPHSYFDNQARISEEQGRGKIVITQEYKQELSQILIQDQQASLDSWLEYLDQEYPTWYQSYTIEGLKKMGSYDKDRNRFSKRRKDYVGTFPELNREALSQVYDHINRYHQDELDLNNIDKKLLGLLKTGSFIRLYEYFLINSKGILEWDKNIIDGEWLTFEQTDDKLKGEELAKSLQGYNTGWCTAGIGTAQEQLNDGDFYVYYSKNKLGIPAVPRVAIRMEDDQVVEVRGIEPEQNMEGLMTPIMKEKIKNLPGGEEYFVKVEHMEFLTSILKKHTDDKELNKKELRFLYQVDEEIQGFGYDEDPRIDTIILERNKRKEDLASCLNLKLEEIVLNYFEPATDSELKNIKYIDGQLAIHSSNITSFPQGLKAKELSIGKESIIEELPGNLQVDTLFLGGNKSVKSLGKGTKIRTIYANDSGLEILPENLEAEEIDIQSSALKKISRGVKVREIKASNSQLEIIEEGTEIFSLIVNDTKLKTLPSMPKTRLLLLEDTEIEELPENLSLTDLWIQETLIKTLPANFTSENIFASGSKLQEIPQGLKCNYLDISYTQVKVLPPEMEIRELDISGTEIRSLPQDLKTEFVRKNKYFK